MHDSKTIHRIGLTFSYKMIQNPDSLWDFSFFSTTQKLFIRVFFVHRVRSNPYLVFLKDLLDPQSDRIFLKDFFHQYLVPDSQARVFFNGIIISIQGVLFS